MLGPRRVDNPAMRLGYRLRRSGCRKRKCVPERLVQQGRGCYIPLGYVSETSPATVTGMWSGSTPRVSLMNRNAS